jgi:hypothetical protein
MMLLFKTITFVMKVWTNIVTTIASYSIRLAAILVIMSVWTFKTVFILYIYI